MEKLLNVPKDVPIVQQKFMLTALMDFLLIASMSVSRDMENSSRCAACDSTTSTVFTKCFPPENSLAVRLEFCGINYAFSAAAMKQTTNLACLENTPA